MVKLKGPLLSTAATGPLANLLDYSTRPNQHVVGKHRRPAQPRTEPQRATRLWMTWLTNQWATLTDGQQASWTPLARQLNIPPYHAYLKHNTQRINTLPGDLSNPYLFDAWPTKAHPATKTGMIGGGHSSSVTTGPGYIQWTRYYTIIREQWCNIFFHITAENPGASIRNLVCAETADQLGWKTTRIYNLTPGYHLFKFVILTTSGLTWIDWFQIDDTVP